jgi:hypothetical protein
MSTALWVRHEYLKAFETSCYVTHIQVSRSPVGYIHVGFKPPLLPYCILNTKQSVDWSFVAEIMLPRQHFNAISLPVYEPHFFFLSSHLSKTRTAVKLWLTDSLIS